MFVEITCLTLCCSDWHHGGKENEMLCSECRLFYKKYGIARVIENRPETPIELRKIREEREARSRETELSLTQVEIDYSLTNPDETSQPATAPEKAERAEGEAEEKPDTDATEAKPEVKTEKVDEPEDQKRKIDAQPNDEEPQIKKAKSEIKTEQTAVRVYSTFL